MPWNIPNREVLGKLKQVAGDVGREVVVQRLFGDVYYGIPSQDDLEGAYFSFVAQHNQQNGNLSNVFSAKILQNCCPNYWHDGV